MGDPAVFVHQIDADDRVTHLNAAWLEFARQNESAHLNEQTVLDRPLWDFIDGATTQRIYRVLLAQVRTTRSPLEVRYRCDAPDVRRYLRMTISPLAGGGVEFASRVEAEESREHVELLSVRLRRGDEHVLMCSWCKAVHTPGGWMGVESATQTMNLILSEALPEITHGICEPCSDELRATQRAAR